MNLGRQVYSLLKRHSTVFVKGLGTFRRIRTSAAFDAKRKVVLPPLSYIEFEHDVQDGYDFTLYVQQSQQIEKSVADSIVQRQVEYLIDSIHTDGQATLEELGQLVSYGHSYIFKPFDLSGFQFLAIEDPYLKEENDSDDSSETAEESIPPTVLDESTIQSEQQEVVEEKTVLKDVLQIDNSPKESASVTSTNMHDAEPQHYFEEERPKRNNTLMYVLIAAVAVITLAGIYYYSIITKKLDNVDQFISGIDTLDQENDSLFAEIDTNALAVADSTALLANDSLATLPQDIPTPAIEEPKNHKFTIVIGTHPKFEQAEAEAAEYQQKGFKHVRAVPSNLAKNRKRVIWDTYPTKELRDSALRYVQKNVKSDAWPAVL
jgi:hypothetical protein